MVDIADMIKEQTLNIKTKKSWKDFLEQNDTKVECENKEI